MAELNINFGFTSSAQTLSSDSRTIRAATNAFARIIVEDVAYRAAVYGSTQAHKVLSGRLRQVVEAELATMAMTIGNSVAITGRARGPQGVMSAHGQPSQTAVNRDWYRSLYNWNRNRTKIKWGKRNPEYLAWKQRNGHTDNWWEVDGSLSRYLGEPRTYTQAFGPIRVIVDPAKNQDRARQRLGRNAQITSSGMTGPATAEYEVAKVRVIALGNISPQDLPSLRTENPDDAKPASGNGLASYLKNADERTKLMTPAWGDKQQRHVLEPFLSFYLTRAIPNAVWRRIEQTPLINRTAGSAGNVSRDYVAPKWNLKS